VFLIFKSLNKELETSYLHESPLNILIVSIYKILYKINKNRKSNLQIK